MTRGTARLLALVMVGLTVGLSACASTYIKQVPGVPEARPAEALVAGFVVRTEHDGQNASLVDVAVDVAQNTQMNAFGAYAAEKLPVVLGKLGFKPVFNGAVTRDLELMKVPDGLAQLSGYWQHPETSALPATAYTGPRFMVESLGNGPHIVKSLEEKGAQYPFVAFVEAIVTENTACGAGALKLWTAPQVRYVVSILDKTGAVVVVAQAVGNGDGSVMFTNRSPTNLKKGLDAGIRTLDKAKVQTY